MLLRAGARRGLAAGRGRPVRHGDQLADHAEGRGRRAQRGARRDRDERGRSHRHRARGVHREAVRRHARSAARSWARRTRSTRSPGTRSSSTTRPGTPRSTWWWPRRATSTTTRWWNWSGGRSAAALDEGGRACPVPPDRRAKRGHPAGVGTTLVSRGIEQANLVLGLGGLARTDERRFALGVLNAAFSSGMRPGCSRRSREKRGLAYSVYSSRGSMRTPASGASTSAACRPRPTRCSPSAPRRSTGWSKAA